MRLKKHYLGPLLGCVVALAGTPFLGAAHDLHAETVLRATASLPSHIIYTKDFLKFVSRVNAVGKGVVQIKYIGGPETMPRGKQAPALRSGIIDMQWGVASFYKGIVPHGDAMVASTISAPKARASGHLDYIGKFWRERLNAHLLGWFSSGIGFHIYLRKEPKRDASGMVDLKGLKIRASPTTRDFIKNLGAIPTVISSSEVYTALERGVVDGNVFPAIGVRDYGWEKFLKYRIDPQFLQTNLVVMVNQNKWKSLSQKARGILQSTAIAFEKESRDFFAGEVDKQKRELSALGLKAIELKGKVRDDYLAAAFRVLWNRLGKKVPDDVAELRRRFYE